MLVKGTEQVPKAMMPRSSTVSSVHACVHCHSFYYKAGTTICFWCRRPRDGKQTTIGGAARRALKPARNVFLDD
jgi:hypothetical protein